MKICTLASSSSGNCTLVSHGGTHILIDAGISLRRITAGLGQLGLEVRDLAGILVTHEHSDHISGMKMLVKYHDVSVLAPNGVARALCCSIPGAERCVSYFDAGSDFVLGEISVRSFPTMHDTPESVGYRFDDGQSVVAGVTDIGSVTPVVLDALTGADMAVIEANHDVVMLKNGGYPAYLKRRILSDRGHLWGDDSGRLATTLVESGTKRLVLAHLSRENNTPRLAHDTVRTMLDRQGVRVGKDICLDTAPPDDLGALYIL